MDYAIVRHIGRNVDYVISGHRRNVDYNLDYHIYVNSYMRLIVIGANCVSYMRPNYSEPLVLTV